MRKEVRASKKYWFVWDEELNNPCAFDAFLFNDPAHLALQPCKNRYSYYLIKKHDEVIHARCTFFIENEVACSPYKGSFGSIEFSDKVFFDLLEEYWDYLETDLRSKDIKEIFIKNYPVCYNPPHAQMLSFLFSTKGFEIKTQELNFHIEVDDVEFERKVHENERKKLSKALKNNYTFQQEKEIDFDRLHSIIDQTRKRKNYPTTLNKEELKVLIKSFPDRLLVVTIRKEAELVAACVVVKISEQILYTFYGADNEKYRNDSPLVLLHFRLYQYAKQENFTIIDLGIGSFKGTGNRGLIRFKEKLGGKMGLKLTNTN